MHTEMVFKFRLKHHTAAYAKALTQKYCVLNIHGAIDGVGDGGFAFGDPNSEQERALQKSDFESSQMLLHFFLFVNFVSKVAKRAHLSFICNGIKA